MTTTRDLIQRLAERLDYLDSNYNLPCQSALIAEAHDYLDQPEPEGPTVMEIIALADEIEAEELGQVDLVRRALARWGRPAVKPVPMSKRLPGEGDCDPSFQCWWFTPSEEKWILWPIKWAGPECSHWLPHHALPLPTTTQGVKE